MASSRTAYEEAIRLVLETEGEQGLDELKKVLTQLGTSTDQTAGKAQQLAKELERLAETSTNLRNYTRLKATVNDTGAALEKAKTRQRELSDELAKAESPTKRLTQANERAAVQVDRLTKLQNRQQAELTRTTNALAKAGVDTDKVAQAYGDLQTRFARFSESADGANGSLRKFAAESSGVEGSARKSSLAIGKIATGLLAVTEVAATAAAAIAAVAAAGTGAFFAGAIKSAVTLEDALNQVKAVSGATAEEMVALKQAAEDGASSTRFTALEAAQGLDELARATGTAGAAIKALPAALNLAQAAGIGVAEAAQFITTTLTQFGLQADRASQVADILALAANSTSTNVQELGNALSYVAPLAKQLGLDAEDTVSVLGALADQGFRGERAGTALRNVFSELLDPSSAFAKALRDLGIESSDFAVVLDQLGKAGVRGREAIQLLDAAARPAILSLVDQGGASLRQLEEQLRASGGAAEQAAQQMGQSTGAATESIEKSFDRVRRSLVEPLLQPLQKELFDLSNELEAFSASPEFEEIKSALTDLFVESAHAARELFQQIDFKALAITIREFVGDATEAMSLFRQNIGAIVTVVEALGDTFSITFNAIQTLVFAAAAAVTKFLELSLRAQQAFTWLPRKMNEFATGSDEAGRRIEEQVGGLSAVYDEFRERAGKNLYETVEATKDLVGATEQAGASAPELAKLADGSAQVAAAAQEAAQALTAQAAATQATAGASGAAAAQVSADAERLKQAFADLGIQSQENLRRAADSAKKNFGLIREAVADGKATAEDARRALTAYAQAARAAVADSDAATKERVEGELEVLEAIHDVRGGLDEMGSAGQRAGQQVAAGAREASRALGQTASTAGGAASAAQQSADAVSNLAQAGWEARNGLYGAAQGAYTAGAGFGELSKAAVQAYLDTNKAISPLTAGGHDSFFDGISEVTDAIREQKRAFDEELKSLGKQAKAFDTLDERRQQLTQKYSFLGAGQIEQMLQAEQQLDQQRKARLDEDARNREEQRAADMQRVQVLEQAQQVAQDAGSTRIPLSDNTLKIELAYPTPAHGGELSPEERRTADRILTYILPKIVQAIARSKSVSVVQRPRR